MERGNGETPGEQAGRRGMRCRSGRPEAEFVAGLVASAFGIPPDLLSGGRGPATVAFARQIGMYLAHTRLGLSLGAAGSLFARDRTTAAHACRMVEDRRDDANIDTLLDCLERAVDLHLQRIAGPL